MNASSPSSCAAPPDNDKDNDDDENRGPVPEGYVRLVSGDGFAFTVEVEYACASSVIDTMLNSAFKESCTRVIRLPHVSGKVLEKVCQYFYYIPRFQHRYPNRSPPPPPSTPTSRSEQQQQLEEMNTLTPTTANTNATVAANTTAAIATTHDDDDDEAVEMFDIPSDLAVDVFLCSKYLDL